MSATGPEDRFTAPPSPAAARGCSQSPQLTVQSIQSIHLISPRNGTSILDCRLSLRSCLCNARGIRSSWPQETHLRPRPDSQLVDRRSVSSMTSFTFGMSMIYMIDHTDRTKARPFGRHCPHQCRSAPKYPCRITLHCGHHHVQWQHISVDFGSATLQVPRTCDTARWSLLHWRMGCTGIHEEACMAVAMSTAVSMDNCQCSRCINGYYYR